jgi:hypothetical protein
MTPTPPSPETPSPEPRWHALLAVLTAGLLYTALPPYLAPGPRWLFILTISLLETPATLSHYRGYHHANRILGYCVSGISTVFLLWSIALLVTSLPTHKEPPVELLQSAAILWFSNILIFALWYWRLDAGGPLSRSRRHAHTQGAFLFPQMTLPSARGTGGTGGWSPQFTDYLFLAFNTSTAFSPTDVPVLSRWAKLLCMTQSLISLATLALLAARAVNIM